MHRLIALALPGGPLFVEQLRRIWDDGDAAFVVDVRLPTQLQRKAANAVKPHAVVTEMGREITLDAEPVEPGDALVVATSGTSGHFKAAVLTHDAVAASATITNEALGVTSSDHWLACLPLAHIGGLSVITKAVHAGTALTVLPRFDDAAVMRAAHAGANLVSLVNATISRIEPHVFRKILLGGGPAPATQPKNAVVTYGMTETGSGVVYDGFALPGVNLRISDEGEIELQSPTLLRCYRDGTNPVSEDGWFKTGDAGEIAANGRLSVLGRRNDAISTGGEKVWPQQVEAVLGNLSDVTGVLVFGEPDAKWGQKVIVALEIRPGAAEPSLEWVRETTKQKLPAYCAPQEVRIVEQLERTTSGKIRRPK